MDSIHIEDLAFFAYHGLLEEEARLGQRFLVDLTCSVDLEPAGISDEYTDTVCYGTIVKAVEAAVTTTRFKLIERLAAEIATTVFKTDSRIRRLRIRVHKPSVPLPINAGRVSVEITRDRPDGL